ncbi:lytic transglycosylase domain-containing protein [uncultured Thiothrix sp.]|uniref:lytic transglycosylase domain-containing protein n=1 Tax=uncultured Thiothrix sp. TaxID=223185 RepID=UPI002636D5FA|nr:lytic transglycosylase domain-containing protein [uncultured Thiothrix sp.]HMT93833.1 lytic transglycosylase domain-containing protein [Thiolinea sp.]
MTGVSFATNAQAGLRTCDQNSPTIIRQKASAYQNLINAVSLQYGVSADLIQAVITAETCFRPTAVSHKGAYGLMQLMPATARRFGATDKSVTHNVHAGTRYLRWLLDRYDGSIYHAVAAYNSGEGTVDRHGWNVPYQETRRYLVQVLNAYRKLSNRNSQVLFAPNVAAAAQFQRASLVEDQLYPQQLESDAVEPVITGKRLRSSKIERVLTPKTAEKRLLPRCKSASKKLKKSTSYKDKKGIRTFFYTVKDNDSIDRISRVTGSSKIMIKRYNDMESKRTIIKPEQVLKVSECSLE